MSLFSDLKPVAHLSRNVFDRSRSETFSTKLGILTPCFVEHTIPKGKYKINCSDIVRVSEQQTANFVGMSQNIEFFFVPYSQLWNKFNKMYYGKGEETRSVNAYINPQDIVPSSVPTFNLKPVFEALFRSCLVADWWSRQYARIIAEGALVGEDLELWLQLKGVLPDPTVSWYEQFHIDVHNRFCGFDQMRVLDMLGYGNFVPFYKYGYVELATAAAADIDAAFLASLDTAVDNAWNKISASIPTNQVNPFALMAYVKVFSDIYRNRIYDDSPYHTLYNVDWFAGTGELDAYSNRVLLAIKPFYRMYKKDVFTGLYPNPQFGGVSVSSVSSLDGKNIRLRYPFVDQADGVTVANNLLSSTRNGQVIANSWSFSGINGSLEQSVSALAVRQAEALQRLKEKLIRAGNREEDLQKAIFGVSSKYIEDGYVDFLGSFQTAIQMNPVAATTQANSIEYGQQNIGDLGAYSVGSLEMGSQKEIEFDAYDFGIILGICYLLPETKYESFGLDPHNAKFVASDYYQPQMQNLGLAPVYSNYINQFGLAGSSPVVRTLGYLSRYWEYKTAFSRVHGEFFGSNPRTEYDYNFPTSWDEPVVVNPVSALFGAFSDYVAPRDIRETSLPTLQMLYVNPADADRIFFLSEGLPQSYDHFKIEMSFRVKAVLPMSVTGLPD